MESLVHTCSQGRAMKGENKSFRYACIPGTLSLFYLIGTSIFYFKLHARSLPDSSPDWTLPALWSSTLGTQVRSATPHAQSGPAPTMPITLHLHLPGSPCFATRSRRENRASTFAHLTAHHRSISYRPLHSSDSIGERRHGEPDKSSPSPSSS